MSCLELLLQPIFAFTAFIVIMKRKNIDTHSQVVYSSDKEDLQDLVDIVFTDPRYEVSWKTPLNQCRSGILRNFLLLVVLKTILRWRLIQLML